MQTWLALAVCIFYEFVQEIDYIFPCNILPTLSSAENKTGSLFGIYKYLWKKNMCTCAHFLTPRYAELWATEEEDMFLEPIKYSSSRNIL